MLTNQCCPASPTLPTIPAVTCKERFGQIQKIIFQRIWRIDGEKNCVISSKMGVLAWWVYLKTSTLNDKIAVTPFIESPADDDGEARTVGGGNASLNGIEKVIGSNPVTFSCKLNNVPQDVIAELKKLVCESLVGNLGVYYVNEVGQIQGLICPNPYNPSGGDVIMPIPIRKYFVSDLKHGGLEGNDYNDLSFAYVPGYSDKLGVVTLDSSALVL